MKAHGKRARLGGVLLAVALAAAAILALPAIGIGKDGSDDRDGPPAAGVVSSFDSETGELTVALGDGGTISALVVRRTQIRCGRGRDHLRGDKHRHDRGASASRRGHGEEGEDRGEDELDDRGGQGEDEAGDDHGGRGFEPGDDHGVHANEGGEDRHGHGGRGHHGGRCGAADLVEGAVVMRAEIVLTHGKALYKKIGLLPSHFNESE
jgi:hypothetical protein